MMFEKKHPGGCISLNRKIFLFAVFFTFFFPFVSFRLLTLDLQPYFFMVGLSLFLYYMRVSVGLCWFFFPVVGFFVSLTISGLDDLSTLVRAFVIYSSPFIVSNAVYFLLKKNPECNEGFFIRLVKFFVVLNFVVGALQFFISPYFFDFLVEVRTSEERGVTGLNPEPSLYGLNLIALAILLASLPGAGFGRFFYLFITFAQVIVFSQSALAFSLVMLILMVFGLFYFFWVSVVFFAALFAAMIGASYFSDGTDGIRVLKILFTFIEDPSGILYADGSISERFYHLFLPLSGYGIPQGFFSFYDKVVQAQLVYPSFWWGDPTNKIMSGFGSAFWELGVFSIPLLLIPFRLAIACFEFKKGFLIGLSVALVFLNSVSYGLPIYSVICGYLAYLGYRQRFLSRTADYPCSFDFR